MNTLLQACFNRARTVLMVLALCLLWGFLAYISIPKESKPDVKIPVIVVTVRYDGISPNDAERLLARPLEQELENIQGIKEIRTKACEGGVNVIAEFFAGLDIDNARKDVMEKTDLAKSKFPKAAKEPEVKEVNLSLFPILSVKLSGEIPKRTLFKLAKDLKEYIESNVKDVLKADIIGNQNEVVEVLLDPNRLEQYALNPEEVIRIFFRNNQIISAGFLENTSGKFSMKVPGLIEQAQQILDIPLKIDEQRMVRFCDVGSVQRAFKDAKTLAHDRVSLNKMAPAVVLEVSKRTGTHLIETVKRVKTVVDLFSKNLPSSVQIQFSQDESHRIFEMLNELENSIILAVLLVMAVIVWALGWKSAFIIGLAVPSSFLIGMMVLQLMGLTVNIVVLFSLIFSVGMLVDGAVIVVEYADCLLQKGHTMAQSYLLAAQRMAWPVITSITTILVVFLPLLFWPGFVGQFMKYMPITLLAVLSSSIAMALIFIPVIAGFLKPSKLIHKGGAFGDETPLIQLYKKTLSWSLAVPKRTLKLAVIVLVIVKVVHSFFGKGTEFFPDVEPDQVMLYVHGRGNLSLYEQEKFVSQVEQNLMDMREIKSMHSTIGECSNSNGIEIPQDAIGVLYLEFVDWQMRRKIKDILPEIEKRTSSIPGIWVETVKQKAGPPSTKSIEIEISALDPEILDRAFLNLKTYMHQNTKLIAIEDNLPLPGIEWLIKVDRTIAQRLDADVVSIGNTIKMLTNGVIIGNYRPDDVKDEIDVIIRFPRSYRNFDQLKMLKIPTKTGTIPLSSVARLKPQQEQGEIDKVDGYKVRKLLTNVIPGVLVSDVVNELKLWVSKNTPKGAQIKFKGEDKEQKESGIFLMKAFGIALFLVAVILVTQFNSFFSMGLVLSAVVMSTIGIFIGLLIHDLAFGVVMGGIGIIALAGIIVSNNIILIDTYDHMVNEQQPKSVEEFRNIITQTCLQRVRPVILTKLTAILGLLPIIFGMNIDFFKFHVSFGAPSNQWWVLLATCIIYGVLFASSLTLLVTPAALLWKAERFLAKKSGKEST